MHSSVQPHNLPVLSGIYNHSDFKYNTPVVIDYKLIFPDYTDHANLHSMTVIDEMEYQSMPGLNVLTVRPSDTAA